MFPLVTNDCCFLLLKSCSATYYSAPVGELSIAISLSVCVCVCLSVCLSASISLELLDRSSGNFLCRSPVAVAESCGGIAIRYVLPVLWMTSRLAVMGLMAKHGGWTVKRLPLAALRDGGRVCCVWMPCSHLTSGLLLDFTHSTS